MDNEKPKPNIKQDKKPGMGEKRASSDDSMGSSNKSAKSDSMIGKVLEKISEAENVLVALSNDPSVDEIAAALGLSMALDAAGKHVTAIYSGKTPNVLQFLKPEERFETGTDSLQDFVIALDKEKADHLRYKIDGDFVKVYVTPYRTTISGDDLEFSRGDYNVDLVMALNVPAATELDAALKEHGRIMHDATSINITNGAEGKFGDLEWVDPNASSISEMVAKLAFELEGKMDEATATALLTGLVAATDRFSNASTTPDAMVLAAKLMGAGADQQLVVQNVRGEVVFNGGGKTIAMSNDGSSEASMDVSKLEINHDDGQEDEGPVAPTETETHDEAEVPEETEKPELKPEESEGLVNPEVPEEGNATEEPVAPTQNGEDAVQAAMSEVMNAATAPEDNLGGTTVAGVDVATEVPNGDGYAGESVADQILSNIEKDGSNVGSADYGKMIDDALNEPVPGEGGIQVGAETASGPQVDTQVVDSIGGTAGTPPEMVPAPSEATLDEQNVTPPPVGNEEEEAMSIIKRAQAETPGLSPNGELPKIITGGGMGINDTMLSGPMPGMGMTAPGVEANPAMASAPAVGATDMTGLPEMNYGAQNMGASMAPTLNPLPGQEQNMGQMGPMPMPGQEMAPPTPPMPDFGTMPPAQVTPAAPEIPAMPEVTPMPTPVPETVPMPDVTVQPDMNAGISAMALPQVQEAPQAPVSDDSSDPSAFKIPGIHT